MQSNFFTSNNNIFQIAEKLTTQNFEELLPTQNYSNCDAIQINGTTKKFWLTTQAEINKITPTINQLKSTIQTITLKEIKKWQTK